jgi:hypothetical protein
MRRRREGRELAGKVPEGEGEGEGYEVIDRLENFFI